MRKLAALVVFGALAFLPAAQAQNPPLPPESHIAAAVDLLKVTNALDSVQAMLESSAPAQRAQLKRLHPELSDEFVESLVQQMNGAIIARGDEMLRLFGILYAGRFGEQELKDLAAFYRSDLGKKYVSQTPSLIKESTPLVMRWIQGVLQQEQQNILKTLPQRDRKT